MNLVSSGAVAIVNEFLVAACAPRENHPSGTLERADAIVAARPDVAHVDIYTAGRSATPMRCVASSPTTPLWRR